MIKGERNEKDKTYKQKIAHTFPSIDHANNITTAGCTCTDKHRK